MMNKTMTIDVYISFNWDGRFIEQFGEEHKVALDHPEYYSDERLAKELHKKQIEEATKDFMLNHAKLLWLEEKSSAPRLEWGFMVDYDGNVRASIDANQREEWNERAINQAKIFIEGLISNHNAVKQSIKVSSNYDLSNCHELFEYLEFKSKDSIRFHYTLNDRYL